MGLGSNVRIARRKNGYTQAQLAKKIGSNSPTSISRIERDETTSPRLSTLKKIAGALNISVAELIGGSVKSNKGNNDDLRRSLLLFIERRGVELAIDGNDRDFLFSLSVNTSIVDHNDDWWEGQLRIFRKHQRGGSAGLKDPARP